MALTQAAPRCVTFTTHIVFNKSQGVKNPLGLFWSYRVQCIVRVVVTIAFVIRIRIVFKLYVERVLLQVKKY